VSLVDQWKCTMRKFAPLRRKITVSRVVWSIGLLSTVLPVTR